MWLYSARACLPLKLALILEGTGAKGGLEQTSVAAALADMFPADLTSLIDMSGKMFAHTVSLSPCHHEAVSKVLSKCEFLTWSKVDLPT